MHWTCRVSLYCLCLTALGMPTAWAQTPVPAGNGNGIVYLDDASTLNNFSGSMAFGPDGGSYFLFQKMIGDGVGFDNGFTRLGLRAKLWEDVDSHLFGELHTLITDTGRIGANVGGGYRWFHGLGLFGVNGWYDNYETNSGFRYQQATFGAEYLHPGLDLRTNVYVPFHERENFAGVASAGTDPLFLGHQLGTNGIGLFERAYYGWDAEAGIPAPLASWMRLYAGPYFLTASDDDTWGIRARAEARVSRDASLYFMVTDDSKFGTNINLNVELRFSGRLSDRFGQDYSALARRYDQVQRTWPIQTHVDREDMFVPLINPNTGAAYNVVWVDNTATPGGDGSLENPYTSLPGQAGGADLILVRAGVGDTTGNIQLFNGQQLLGAGHQHSVPTERLGVIALPDDLSPTGPTPTLIGNGTATPVVTLASNNKVSSFTFNAQNAIYGNTSNNFILTHLDGTVTNGINIVNGGGTGVVQDGHFVLNPGGTGIAIGNTSGSALNLTLGNLSTTGGATGLSLSATDADIDFSMTNFTGTGATTAGLALRATRGALTGTTADVDVSDNPGHGIQFNAVDGDSNLVFERLTANDNGRDGIYAVANNGSDVSLSIIDSELTGNADDNIDANAINLSTMNVFIDPTDLSGAGNNNIELRADAGSGFALILDEVTMTDAGVDALNANITNGSTFALGSANVNANAAGDDGFDISVADSSVFMASIQDSTFNFEGGTGLRLFTTNSSESTVDLLNVETRSNGEIGLDFAVAGPISGPSTLEMTITDSMLSGNGISNIRGFSGNGSDALLRVSNVNANNDAFSGAVALQSRTAGRIVTHWDGGSIAGAIGDGIVADAADAGSRITMFLDNLTIRGNANGIQASAAGDNARVRLDLSNVAVTHNQGDGLNFDLISGGDLAVNVAADSGTTFSDNDDNAIDGTMNGAGTTATLNLSNLTADNSGATGIDIFAERNSTLQMNMLDAGASVSNSGLDGIALRTETGASANVILSGLTATGSGRDGLAFRAFSGSSMQLALLDGTDFSGSGASGVNGLSTGAGTGVLATFDSVVSDGNGGDGYTLRAGAGGTFIGEIITTDSATNGIASASNNLGDGINLSVTGTGTQAALVMEGDIAVSGNGGRGISATATNADSFGIQVSGDIQDNGSDGVMISSTDVGTTAIEFAGNANVISGNGGQGMDIDLSNTTLDDITVTTLTQTETIEAFSASGYTTTDNGGNGFSVALANTTVDTLTVSGIESTNNTGNGIEILLDNTTVNNLDVNNNTAQFNNGDGLLIQAQNGSAVSGAVNLNVLTGNGGNGLHMDFDDSSLTDFAITRNSILNNGGDGILFDFQNSPITNLSITDNPDINQNVGNGINFQMVDSNIDGLLIDNNGMGTLTPGPISEYDIVVTILGGLTPSQQQIFLDAAARWSEIVLNDLPDVSDSLGTVDDLEVTAEGVAIDGAGGILGQAGPTELRSGSLLPFRGLMQFDTADLATFEALGELDEIILHEMAHTMGFGTLWELFGLSTGIGTSDPRFIGPNALAEYNARFGLSDTSVPIENLGFPGDGTYGGHWRESVFDNELMTGFINSGEPNPLSRITIGALEDMGYVVNYNAADPYITTGASSGSSGGSSGSSIPDGTILRPDVRIYDGSDSSTPSANTQVASIKMNGENGINISLNNSNLQNGMISNNIISDHANGDGVRLVNPTTQGAEIQLDFLQNTITNNSGDAINVSLTGGESLNSSLVRNDLSGNGGRGVNLQATDSTLNIRRLSQNTIDSNGGMGVRVAADGASDITFHAGSAVDDTKLNQITNNVDAGIGISLMDSSTGDIVITHTSAGSTNAGSDATFLGEGLHVETTDTAVITGMQIGDTSDTTNTFFSGNDSHGIAIHGNLSSVNTDPVVQNTQANLNGGDGMNFVRSGSAVLDNFTITGNDFNENSDDGLDITSSVGNLTDEFTISHNSMSQNLNRGLSLRAEFDADIVADVTGNTIANNVNDGVQLSEATVAPVDSRSITANFIDNAIVGNGGNGINVQALHDLVIDQNIIDDNDLDGINLESDALNPADPTVISNNEITNNGQSGVDIAAAGNTVDLTGNTIEGNGFNGINNQVGADSTIIDNTISGNAADGIALMGGTHTINNNVIESNGRDGIELIAQAGSDLTVDADGNQVRVNNGRGIDLLVRGTAVADVEFNNGVVEGNIEEGVYVITTADANQSEDALATDPLADQGSIFASPELVFNFHDNTVINNGVGSGFEGSGLVIRVGTSGALDTDNSYEDDGGFASDGLGYTTANLTGRGGILANVTNNSISGHPGADVLIESFVSTVDPAFGNGLWDNVEYSPSGYEQDPLARIDLNFVGNSGDDLDVTRPGATYNNTSNQFFKSRNANQTPPGPFTDPFVETQNRERNAQRQAFRGTNSFGDFSDPAATTIGTGGNSDDYLYPGVGDSTFRVSAGSSTAGFGAGDDFTDSEPIPNAIFGELPFEWGTY